MAHLLIVDDEQSICWGLTKLAREAGPHGGRRRLGRAGAWPAAATQPPDAIVLDVRLPGMDGLAAMEQFRRTCWARADHHHHRLRRSGHGRRGRAQRGLRVSGQAVRPERRRAGDPAGPGSAGASAADSRARGRQRDRRSRDRRLVAGHAGGVQADRRGRALRRVRPPPRRERHGQGTGRPGDPPLQPPRPAGRSWPSTWPRSARRWPRASCSATSAARSPAPSRRARACWNRPTAARSSSTRWPTFPCRSRSSCSACWSTARSCRSAATGRCSSDFRVISATHQNLRQRVAEGAFPPRPVLPADHVRDRDPAAPRAAPTTFGELADHFLDAPGGRRTAAAAAAIAAETIAALERRPWHGNVRELRNAIEHAMILARGGTILPEHLPPPTPPSNDSGQRPPGHAGVADPRLGAGPARPVAGATDLYERLLRVVEPPLLDAVLQRHRGQFAAAARQLGLHRVTLKKKADQFKGRQE